MDNTVVALVIPSIVAVKIITRNNNQYQREFPESLTGVQLLIQLPALYRTCIFFTIFTIAYHLPD